MRTFNDRKKLSQYVPNHQFLLDPNHKKSLGYVQSLQSSPSNDIECFYFFPAQHDHRQTIIPINCEDIAGITKSNLNGPKGFINDTIVEFALFNTYASWPANFKQNVYVCKPLFWQQLQTIKDENASQNQIKRTLKWTKHVKHLFNKKYLLIPKFKNYHWQFFIVCNARQALFYPSESASLPCILNCDSMSQTNKLSDFELIRKWLNLELSQRMLCHKEPFNTKSIGGHCAKVPRQPNGIDCAFFFLRSVLQFGLQRGFTDTSRPHLLSLKYRGNDGVMYRKDIEHIVRRLIAQQKPKINSLSLKPKK